MAISSPEIELHRSANRVTVISLPSSSCFVLPRAEFSNKTTDFRALTYALEEIFPLDAERMSFHAGSELITVVDGRAIADFYQSQRVNNECCIAATPRALLIAQAAVEYLKSTEPVVFLIVLGTQTDIVHVKNEKVIAWQWTETKIEAMIPLITSMLAVSLPQPLIAIIASTKFQNEWTSQDDFPCKFIDISAHQLETQVVTRIQAGMAPPWVNLNNGPLAFVDLMGPAKGQLRFFAFAGIVS